MIRVQRSPKPAILARKEADWLDALRRASTPKARELALAKYRHEQIQQALQTMFHGKCAYCESKIGHVSYAHIEHYRPKSRFPDLTFEWENLLLACSQCNSACKGDHFPEADENGPILNPCIDDPDNHLTFLYDAQANLATVSGTTERGVTTETLLGLNRADLRTYRSKHIQRLAALMTHAEDDSEAAQLLREALQDDAEYAAFARAL